MSGFISFASGGVDQTPSYSYEIAGWNAGAGTTVSATTANTKGSYAQIIASTANEWSGMWVVFRPHSTTARYAIDISTNGGSSAICTDVWFYPATGLARIFLPLHVAAGSDVQIRLQSSAGTASGTFMIEGQIKQTNGFAGFSNCENITTLGTTTLPGDTDVAIANPLSSSWTTLVASTARAYSAISLSIGANGNPSAAQHIGLEVATGAAASEATILAIFANPSASSVQIPNAGGILAYKSISSSVRISARAYGASGTDPLRVQLLGFY